MMGDSATVAQVGIAIVGGGLAALRAAETLRRSGYQDQVTIFSDEPHFSYNRPPLSKAALKNGPDANALAFTRRPDVDDVVWKLETRVEAVDLDAKTIRTESGTVYGFQGLIAATGVRSRQLPIPGPQEGRHVLRTIEDVSTVHSLLRPGTDVVIVGAGFIGCEVAATVRDAGCNVSIVAADPEAMIRPLGADVGASIRERHESRGVRFHLGQGLNRYLGDDKITGVELSDGTTLKADFVIEAVGSQCNVEWLAGNGLDLTDGVRVNGHLVADHPTPLVAIGDVARFPNMLFDETPRRIEHWQVAGDTGKFGALSLLAAMGHREFDAEIGIVPYFWSDQGDLKLQSFGAPNLADRTELLEGDLSDEAAVGYFQGSRLVAVVLLGLQRKAVTYRGLVAESCKVAAPSI
jgi:3-phenylpropionate/trans-cinnamate dioxygenase ferredoxin reductase component